LKTALTLHTAHAVDLRSLHSLMTIIRRLLINIFYFLSQEFDDEGEITNEAEIKQWTRKVYWLEIA
jgi:hypothetical protein